jgi:hypothetical protein
MLLFDFFLHDTQHSLPMLGMTPQATLRREMEVMVDSLFLSELCVKILICAREDRICAQA